MAFINDSKFIMVEKNWEKALIYIKVGAFAF